MKSVLQRTISLIALLSTISLLIPSSTIFADGVTWTPHAIPGAPANWLSITSSSDGTKRAAVVSGGDIWTSTDSGATWTDQTDAGSRQWISITSSSDGT